MPELLVFLRVHSSTAVVLWVFFWEQLFVSSRTRSATCAPEVVTARVQGSGTRGLEGAESGSQLESHAGSVFYTTCCGVLTGQGGALDVGDAVACCLAIYP